MKVVAISGGFDPLHVGHLRYIQAASKLGDRLIVILNDDDFLRKKKGYLCFTEGEREELLYGIKGVDYVYIHHSEDGSVNEALHILKPDIFAKGGDRRPDGVPIPEHNTCMSLGIEVVYGVGGNDKPNSSSWVIEDILEQLRGR